jgi:hypothetical protein
MEPGLASNLVSSGREQPQERADALFLALVRLLARKAARGLIEGESASRPAIPAPSQEVPK